MKELKRYAMAKINLGLDVLRKREDGYHDLRMVMQSIGVCDEITLRVTREAGIRLHTNRKDLPSDGRNLACRGAKLLMDEFQIEQGLEIELIKKIPVAAGLAGGSTDAAAVLRGVNELFDLGLSVQDLMDRGVTIGADIPYCIIGGTALAEGIGEKLTQLPDAPRLTVVLAKPPVEVSTGFVYGNLKADQLKEHPDIDGQITAIRQQKAHEMAERMGNVLETVTVPAYPVIEEIKNQLKAAGALNAMMSGSGPTVFGLFEDVPSAQNACRKLKERGLAQEIFLTEMTGKSL